MTDLDVSPDTCPKIAPIAPIERMETGLPGLDDILGGGPVRGAAYIVRGPPGAGKTIIANQVCHQRTPR